MPRASQYSNRAPYSSLLLGPHYALLRKEFSKWQDWKRKVPEIAQNLLVTLGGGDPENVTSKVIEAIQEVKSDELRVVVVAATNSYYEELKSIVKNSKRHIQLRKNVTDMPKLMAWADLAVSAGGITALELAFMGLPTISITLADNQCQVVKEFEKAGVALNLGWHKSLKSSEIAKEITQLLTNAKMRGKMSRNAQSIVDGKGASRVLAEIQRVESPWKKKSQ